MKKTPLLPKYAALLALTLTATLPSCIEDDYDPCPYSNMKAEDEPDPEDYEGGIDWRSMPETIKVKTGDILYAKNNGVTYKLRVEKAEAGKVTVSCGSYLYDASSEKACTINPYTDPVYLFVVKPNTTELVSATQSSVKKIALKSKRTRFVNPNQEFEVEDNGIDWTNAKTYIKPALGRYYAKHGNTIYQFNCDILGGNLLSFKFSTGENITLTYSQAACLTDPKAVSTSDMIDNPLHALMAWDYASNLLRSPRQYTKNGTIETYFVKK